MRKIKEVLAAGMIPTIKNNYGRIMIAVFAGLLLQIGIIGYSQTVTMTVKNESLEKVFLEIQKQTGYGFAYKTEILKKGKAVDIDVKQASLEDVLAICMKDQPLSYTIVDRVIVISKKEENIDFMYGVRNVKYKTSNVKCKIGESRYNIVFLNDRMLQFYI